MEEAHVLGAVLPVGQRVASERPVDGVKQAVPDAVGGAKHENDWLRGRIEDDENQGDEGLEASARIDENLAPLLPVGEVAAQQTKRDRHQQHDEKPEGQEARGVGDPYNVAEEVQKVGGDRCDTGRNKKPGQDDPRKVAAEHRTQELPDHRPDRLMLDAWRQRLGAFARRRQRRRDERREDDQGEGEEDPSILVRAVQDAVRKEPASAAKLNHGRQESARATELLRRNYVGDDPGEGCACGVEEELDPAVADHELEVAV